MYQSFPGRSLNPKVDIFATCVPVDSIQGLTSKISRGVTKSSSKGFKGSNRRAKQSKKKRKPPILRGAQNCSSIAIKESD